MLVLAGHCDVPAYVVSRLRRKPLQNYQKALAPEPRKPVHNYERALAREAKNARTELTGSRLPVSVPLIIDSSINRMPEMSAAEAELVNTIKKTIDITAMLVKPLKQKTLSQQRAIRHYTSPYANHQIACKTI